jgi:hypothetical protein
MLGAFTKVQDQPGAGERNGDGGPGNYGYPEASFHG